MQTLGYHGKMCLRYVIMPFIIYKVIKYRKILIKYKVYLKKLYSTCENIKSCISHVKM